MKLSGGAARLTRLVPNRIRGLYAWLLPPWPVILHRGRCSGRHYRTPLFAFRRERTRHRAALRPGAGLASQSAGRGGQAIRAGRTFTGRPPEVIATSGAGPLHPPLSPPERPSCRPPEQPADPHPCPPPP